MDETCEHQTAEHYKGCNVSTPGLVTEGNWGLPLRNVVIFKKMCAFRAYVLILTVHSLPKASKPMDGDGRGGKKVKRTFREH